jgi:kynurenine formamidase
LLCFLCYVIASVCLSATASYVTPHDLNSPGSTLEAAKWLIDDRQAMTLGGDNIGLEALPAPTQVNWVPVHTYLEAERGVNLIEVVDLEALSRDKVYEFVFIGALRKLWGATGSPMRPIAIPVQ